MTATYEATAEFLTEGIWHVTSKGFYERIIHDGEIKAEPNIPWDKRWNTAAGEKYYPLVRTLGGISLFDFSTDESNDIHHEGSIDFIPKSCNDDLADIVWIEIDRDIIKDRIIDNKELMRRWNEGKTRNNIIPIYEIALIGSLPITSFIRVIEGKDKVWIERRIRSVSNFAE